MTRHSFAAAQLIFEAAGYASRLLVSRPEYVEMQLELLQIAMQRCEDEPAIHPLIARLDAILERDDEDTDETARLIFEALAK